MQELTYIGPSKSVNVGGVVVARGESGTFDDAVAGTLVASGDFKPKPIRKAKTPPKGDTK